MGDELRQQYWIFDMFILDRTDRELHSLKCLDLKFGLQSSAFFRLFWKNICYPSCCSLVCSGFLKRLFVH